MQDTWNGTLKRISFEDVNVKSLSFILLVTVHWQDSRVKQHTHKGCFPPQKTIFPDLEMKFNFRSLIGEKAEKGERIAEVWNMKVTAAAAGLFH